MAEQSSPGGWSEYTCSLSKTDTKVFGEAFEGFAGVKYVPIAVAHQVVAGTNYSFFCNATGAYPGAITHPSLVSIFAPLEGPPEITNIQLLKQS